MSTPNYLLYKMPHVSTNLWLPTLRDRNVNEAHTDKLLWLKNGNKVTRVAPPNLLPIFHNEDNSYQWILYRAKDNLQSKSRLKYDGNRTVTLIGDLGTNLPGFANFITPIAGRDDLYTVPDNIAERLLGNDEHTGNTIGGNAKVDVTTVKMPEGNIAIAGNANVSGTSFQTSKFSKNLYTIEDYTIRNSKVRLEGSLQGAGEITNSNLRNVYAEGDQDTPVSLSCNNASAKDVSVKNSTMNLDGSQADLVSAEGGANVTVSGDVKLHRAHFEQGTFNISGSLSIASVVFKNGNLDAKINHPDHHDVSRRSGGRWITICPNNHVHYSLKSALNPPHSRWGSVHGFKDAAEVALRVAADIKHANADVERYCIAPATHTSGDTCRCGLFFGLFLLGDQSAVEYFARAAGVVTNLTEIYDGIPKSQLEDKLYGTLDKVAKRRDEADMFDGIWRISTAVLGDTYYWDGEGCVKYIKELTGLTDIGVLMGETIED